VFRARTARRHPDSMRPSHLLAPGVVLAAASAVVAPSPLRRLSRLGLAAYGATLLLAGARSRHAAQSPGEAALVPVALLVMHAAHGAGQIYGWVTFGPPLRAVAHMCGLEGGIASSGAEREPVYAPSLNGDSPATGTTEGSPSRPG
jgi:hypothetical protein